MPNLQQLEAAIGTAEGYGIPGAIPTLANNPGDLELGDLGLGTLNGVTVFPDTASGYSALDAQINAMVNGTSSVYNPSMTLQQAGNIYSNGDPNWANNVANALGISPTSTLGSLLDGNSTASNPTTTPSTSTSTSSGGFFTVENVVILIVGIILIAAGLFSFRTTQNVIQSATRSLKSTAEDAA